MVASAPTLLPTIQMRSRGAFGDGETDDTPVLLGIYAELSASAAGWGTVEFGPCHGGYRLKPGVVAGAPFPSRIRHRGCGYDGRVLLLEEDTPHTFTDGDQTMTSTTATLNVENTSGFAASGSFLIRGDTTDAIASASYTAKTPSSLIGAKLTAATVLVGDQILPEGTLTVVSTGGFPKSGVLNVGGQQVSYTDKTANVLDLATGLTVATFLNCTGGTGAFPDGTPVTADGYFLPDGAGIGQAMNLFNNADPTHGNDDGCFESMFFEGPGRLGSVVLNDLTTKAIRFATNTSNTTGPTGHCNRPRVEDCDFLNWPGPCVHAFNVLDGFFDENRLDGCLRGGIVGGFDSHGNSIKKNKIKNNHDDCINWQGRGATGGIGPGATTPTRFSINENEVQMATWVGEAAQLNNGIVIRGGEHGEVMGNRVEGSDNISTIAAGISFRNQGASDVKHMKVSGNHVFNTGALGYAFLSGDNVLNGGLMDDISGTDNTAENTQREGVLIQCRNQGAVINDLAVAYKMLRDCGASQGVAAIKFADGSLVHGPLVSGLELEATIVNPAGSAINGDAWIGFKTARIKARIRNPNRLNAVNTDAVRLDSSGAQVLFSDVILDLEVIVDTPPSNGVRYALSALAGPNAANFKVRRPTIDRRQFTTAVFSITAGGDHTIDHPNPGGHVTLTDAPGGTVALDSALGTYFTLATTPSSARTIGIPSGGYPGWRFTLEIVGATGATTVFPAQLPTSGYADPANGKRRTATFEKVDDTTSIWRQIGAWSGDL